MTRQLLASNARARVGSDAPHLSPVAATCYGTSTCNVDLPAAAGGADEKLGGHCNFRTNFGHGCEPRDDSGAGTACQKGRQRCSAADQFDEPLVAWRRSQLRQIIGRVPHWIGLRNTSCLRSILGGDF